MAKAMILNFLSTHKMEMKENFRIQKIGSFDSYAKDEGEIKNMYDWYFGKTE